jgi:hypothetical protein
MRLHRVGTEPLAFQAPARLITARPNFRIQAPAGELRVAGPEGWWAPAAPDPDRYALGRPSVVVSMRIEKT